MIHGDTPLEPEGARERSQNAAALLSAVGAGVAGAGVGVLFAGALARYALWLLGLGVLAHVVGMIGKRRAERRRSYRAAPWEQVAYWSCWVALAGLAIHVLA